MKKNSCQAFTLIEMLTVMIIIAVLASLVMAVSGFVNRKAATQRAEGEIAAMAAALESYKADTGFYPRNDDTDKLDPRKNGSPTGDKYQKASVFLYSALANDFEPKEKPDGKPEGKPYFEFKPTMLGGDKKEGKLTEIKYIADPFGNSYGYSTKGSRWEEEFQALARVDRTAKRDDVKEEHRGGFNSTFDLWSTGGSLATKEPTDQDRKKWVKNW